MTGYTAKAWFHHLFSAKGPRSVHSPWLYDLYSSLRNPEAIKDSRVVKLALLRGQLLDDRSTLEFDELGSRQCHVKSTVSKVFRRTAKPPKQAEMLAELASKCNGKTILELGTAFGTTTLALHFAAPKSPIITLEGVPEIAAIAQQNFKQTDSKHIELKIGRFADTLPETVESVKEISLTFIDGHHSRIPTLEYLEILFPSLAEKAIVVIDDIYYSRDMSQCWSELQQHPAFQVKLDFFHFGLLIKNPDLTAECFRLRL